MPMFQAHSIRLPVSIFETLKLRMKVNRRTFNSELVYIIEQYLEQSARSDALAIETLRHHQTTDARSKAVGCD